MAHLGGTLMDNKTNYEITTIVGDVGISGLGVLAAILRSETYAILQYARS